MTVKKTKKSRWIVFSLVLTTVVFALAGCFYIGNLSPQASFTATQSNGTTPLAVDFDASASSDADGLITSYLWDFGDTQTGSGVLVSHTFTVQSESEVFTVILTITDDDGASDQATGNISVNPS